MLVSTFIMLFIALASFEAGLWLGKRRERKLNLKKCKKCGFKKAYYRV